MDIYAGFEDRVMQVVEYTRISIGVSWEDLGTKGVLQEQVVRKALFCGLFRFSGRGDGLLRLWCDEAKKKRLPIVHK